MRMVAIGGSDAGISAALRARELDPSAEVTVVLADAYPNFSICGIPYYISRDVADWRSLAHRTFGDLESPGSRCASTRSRDGSTRAVIASTLPSTVAVRSSTTRSSLRRERCRSSPRSPASITSGADGVHLLHTIGDTHELTRTLEQRHVKRAVIVGAGYVGLEMAEALTARGLAVTQLEQLPEVLPTVDPELGTLVHAELERSGVIVLTGARVDEILEASPGSDGKLQVRATKDERPLHFTADLVLVSVGVRPDSQLGASAGVELGINDAIAVDSQMRTNLPDVFAAGDCVATDHRLLGPTYLPLGTTAHKQGRVAGENAVGGSGSSQAASAPKSSRSSSSSPHGPACATTRRRPPGFTR